METYLPTIKAILSDWIQLTLNNPFYVAALSTAVFLLTAIIYNIRIASLNKINVASEKARIELQNHLNTAQQQMQLMQGELAANIEQMEKAKQLAQKESQRAAGFEEQLSQRNQQVAGIIQSLHTSFDLGERPLPAMGDIKAEGLWQQHDRVINLLSTRLRGEQQAKTELQQSYQVEKVIRAEKEALLETLQASFATQTSQLSKLEQSLEEQKSILQEQQDKAQQALSQILEKHQAELERLTELEQQALELVNTRQQLMQLEEKLTGKDALITQLQKDKSIEQVKGQAQPAPLKQEQIEMIIELPKTEEDLSSAPLSMEEQPVSPVKEQPVSPVKEHPVSPVKEQTGGVGGKLKNLFGSKQQLKKTKQVEPEIQTAPVAIEQPPVSPVKDKYGRTKYYFGDIKQEAEDTKQDEAETQPAPVEVEQSSMSPAKGRLGKLKNLFGSKQQPKEETQLEEVQPAPSEEEQPPKNTIKIPIGKLKNLFGKTK